MEQEQHQCGGAYLGDCGVGKIERKVEGVWYCQKHYRRLTRLGSIEDPRTAREVTPERFWEMHERQENGCLLWTGQLDKDGYGRIYIAEFYRQRKQPVVSVHRYAWYLTHGKMPTRTIDHTCHDPTVCSGGLECLHRRCSEPTHLQNVTAAANTIRSVRNVNRSLGLCYKGLHEMTSENTMIAAGKERCLTCYARYQIEYWEKKIVKASVEGAAEVGLKYFKTPENMERAAEYLERGGVKPSKKLPRTTPDTEVSY